MSEKIQTHTIVSIGSSHLAASVLQLKSDETAEIVDFREREGAFLYRGQWGDVGKAADEVRQLLDGLGGISLRHHNHVHVLLSHSQIKKYDFGTSIGFGEEHDVITDRDIALVHDQTKRVVAVPLKERIISSYVQEYMVNDLSGIRDPVGISGERLAVKLALFTIPENLARQIEKVFEIIGLNVETWYPRSMAGAVAYMRDEILKSGGLMLELGSSLTEVVGFERHELKFYKPILAGIDTIAAMIEKTHTVDHEEALALTKQYGAFGARPHEEEKLPIKARDGAELTYLPSKDFNRCLDDGLSKIVDELMEAIQEAQSTFSQPPQLAISGQAVAMNTLVERLEARCGQAIELPNIKATSIQYNAENSSRFAAILGRAMLIAEEVTKERALYLATPPLRRLIGRIREWTQEHF